MPVLLAHVTTSQINSNMLRTRNFRVVDCIQLLHFPRCPHRQPVEKRYDIFYFEIE